MKELENSTGQRSRPCSRIKGGNKLNLYLPEIDELRPKACPFVKTGATMAALRLERARSAGLVHSAAGNLELTPRGRLLAGVFSWLRDLFGHDAEPWR